LKEKVDDELRKAGYIPFGGGKHLCPGRNIAFAEILGTLAALLLGFEVRGTDGGLIQVPSRRGEAWFRDFLNQRAKGCG